MPDRIKKMVRAIVERTAWPDPVVEAPGSDIIEVEESDDGF
jgi:hypothetical protein